MFAPNLERSKSYLLIPMNNNFGFALRRKGSVWRSPCV